jgi:hypothetical protein
MFEAIFIGMSLFEAAVWFLGGLIFTGIGLAFFVDSVWFRRHAERKRARILGVIGRKKTEKKGQSHYWPVYEYTARSGESVRVRASSSGSLAGNMPDSFRDILVDPEDPYDARSVVPIGMIVGVVCFFIGMGLFAISNTVNDNMGLVSLAVVALVALMGLKASVTRKSSSGPKKPRLQRKLSDRKKKQRTPDLSEILTLEEHLAVLRGFDSSRRKWLPIVALIAVALLVFGVWRGRELVLLQSMGSRAEGTVVRIESKHDSSGEGGGTTYYSVVRFEAEDGGDVTFRDGIGASHPIDRRGEILGVMYDPAIPATAMIDRGMWNWAIPGGCMALGGIVAICSVRGAAGGFRRRSL